MFSPKFLLICFCIFIIGNLLCNAAQGVFMGDDVASIVNQGKSVTPVNATSLVWSVMTSAFTWDKYEILNDGTVISKIVKLGLTIVSIVVMFSIAGIIISLATGVISRFT